MSSANDWISPDRFRAIAAHLESYFGSSMRVIADELRRNAAFIEDVEGAKKRKLEMIANMPESRARMMQKTIDFHQEQATQFRGRVEFLERLLRALIPHVDNTGRALASLADDSWITDVYEAASYCSRDDGHSGPCNGFPRTTCAQRATIEHDPRASRVDSDAGPRSAEKG